MHTYGNAVMRANNPFLSWTWKILMKNENDRIACAPTSLRTNSQHAFIYKRQMRIIIKRFTMIQRLTGFLVLLNNLKYYSKYKKLLYSHLFREKTTCVLSICPATTELTCIQHASLVFKVILIVISWKLNPALQCKLRNPLGYFADKSKTFSISEMCA